MTCSKLRNDQRHQSKDLNPAHRRWGDLWFFKAKVLQALHQSLTYPQVGRRANSCWYYPSREARLRVPKENVPWGRRRDGSFKIACYLQTRPQDLCQPWRSVLEDHSSVYQRLAWPWCWGHRVDPSCNGSLRFGHQYITLRWQFKGWEDDWSCQTKS